MRILRDEDSLPESSSLFSSLLLLVMLEYCFNQPAQDIEPTSRESILIQVMNLTQVMNIHYLG